MDLDPLRVAAIVSDRLCTFELGIVVEIFGLVRPELDPWYTFRTVSIDPGPLRATGGLSLGPLPGLGALRGCGTLVVPGWRDPDEPVPERLCERLRRAHARGARILSVCSGVFVLAAAGLLDGRRATTHWRYAERLTQRYPALDVDPDVLYIDEGDVLTSAGSAAGIDLCLHLVRRDFGADVANRVARRLVVPPHREGGQRQFVPAPVDQDPGEAGFARLLDDLRRTLERPHSVATMARRAKTSVRTLARRFEQKTGTTPYRWLTAERVQRAQVLLETSDLAIERIAERCGFGDAQALRQHFRRHVGTSPATFRRTFRQRGSQRSRQ